MVTLNAADTQKYLKSFSHEIALIQEGTSIGYHINNKTGRLCIRSGGQTFTIESGYKKVIVTCANNLLLTHAERHNVTTLDMPLPNRQNGTVGAAAVSLSLQYIVPTSYNASELQTYHCQVATTGASRIRPFGSIHKPAITPVYLNDFSARRNPIYYPRGTQVT